MNDTPPDTTAAAAATELLRYDHVTVHVARLDGPLFAPLSFAIHPGDKLVISAPSRMGKSPALRAAIGAQPGTQGAVFCLGERVSALSPHALLSLRRRVGFVPATGGLLSNLNLYANLTLLLRYHDEVPQEEIDRRAAQVCDELGLGDLTGRPLASANHQERHLIAIARAWLPRPPLLILDDPDFGLDDETASALWERLAALRAAHQVAMLVATSRPRLALRHGGRHLPLRPSEAP